MRYIGIFRVFTVATLLFASQAHAAGHPAYVTLIESSQSISDRIKNHRALNGIRKLPAQLVKLSSRSKVSRAASVTPQLLKLNLINATTDGVVASVPVNTTDLVMTAPPGVLENASIEAVFNIPLPGGIKMVMGNVAQRREMGIPYTLAGDYQGDFYGIKLPTDIRYFEIRGCSSAADKNCLKLFKGTLTLKVGKVGEATATPTATPKVIAATPVPVLPTKLPTDAPIPVKASATPTLKPANTSIPIVAATATPTRIATATKIPAVAQPTSTNIPTKTATPTSTATSTATATPTRTPTPTATQIVAVGAGLTPTPTPTRPANLGPLLLGFDNIQSDFNDSNKTVTLLRDQMGTSSMRGWIEMNIQKGPDAPSFDYYRGMRSKGFITVVTFNLPYNSTQLPTAEQTRTFFKKAIAINNGAVDYWSIGNESNVSNYWPGTLQQYMELFLIPAAEELHAANQLVVGTSISWDWNKVQELVNLGMLNYVDAVAYHPYSPDGKGTVDRVKSVLAMIKGKPLFLTEFNTYNQQNLTNPAYHMTQLEIGFEGVKNLVSGLWYYNDVYSYNNAGVGAPFDATGAKRPAYFCTLYRLYNGVESSATECH